MRMMRNLPSVAFLDIWRMVLEWNWKYSIFFNNSLYFVYFDLLKILGYLYCSSFLRNLTICISRVNEFGLYN